LKKILVIDDEKVMADMIRGFLVNKGYKVFNAYSGAEGISAVKETAPDLIVLDLQMPKMNGFEVRSYLKKNPAAVNIPVIVFTLSVSEASRNRSMMMGASKYLDKSLGEEVLAMEIEEQLRRKQ
jgi:chemosensory pili system protein ChpA (sensor histidine kinase/response regulator)